MPRHARLKVPGHPLHVYQRGHDKKPCFATTADKTLYLVLLAESSRLYSCLVHAFVLMTNHVHLLISRRFISGGSAEAELVAIRGATSAGVPLASPQFLAQLPSECQLTARPTGRPKKVRTAGERIPLYGKPGLSRF